MSKNKKIMEKGGGSTFSAEKTRSIFFSKEFFFNVLQLITVNAFDIYIYRLVMIKIQYYNI